MRALALLPSCYFTFCLLLQEMLRTVTKPIIIHGKLLLIYQQLKNAFCKLITYFTPTRFGFCLRLFQGVTE